MYQASYLSIYPSNWSQLITGTVSAWPTWTFPTLAPGPLVGDDGALISGSLPRYPKCHSLPDVLHRPGWGLSVGVPQRLRCTVHSTVLSCHCLSSSLPLLYHHPPSWSGHACPPCPGRRQQSRGTDLEQNKHYWMAAFHIPERSQSMTVDLWSNVVWSEPAEAASVPLLDPLSSTLCLLPDNA